MASTPATATAQHVVHIEAVQTAVPTRVVEPGRTRLVAVAAPPLQAPALQRRVRAVLYYRGAGADGTAAPGAWEDGVWVKESLSEALADHPEMAGRLRRRADGSWEVKLNDTGVRLLQATVDATLDEFLAGKGLARREAALAPWTDVNADDPDMCPPFFMQLTRFQGDGGYAVGVSCALVLADPLTLARFLLSWARSHARMRAQSKVTPLPMAQYLAYFQRPETTRKRVRSVPIDSVGDNAAETVLFRTGTAAADSGHGDHRALAAACVDKASEALGKKAMVSRLSVVVVDAPAPAAGDDCLAGKTTIVETCTTSGGGAGAGASLEAVQWSELGLEELVLRDSKPVHVSCSIVTGGGEDEGLVVVMPDGAGSLLVTATLPK